VCFSVNVYNNEETVKSKLCDYYNRAPIKRYWRWRLLTWVTYRRHSWPTHVMFGVFSWHCIFLIMCCNLYVIYSCVNDKPVRFYYSILLFSVVVYILWIYLNKLYKSCCRKETALSVFINPYLWIRSYQRGCSITDFKTVFHIHCVTEYSLF